MAIETLDDIVEEIADRAGVFDGCTVPDFAGCLEQAECACGPMFVSQLRMRILRAVRVEAALQEQKP